jgi:hypothetical protein
MCRGSLRPRWRPRKRARVTSALSASLDHGA